MNGLSLLGVAAGVVVVLYVFYRISVGRPL